MAHEEGEAYAIVASVSVVRGNGEEALRLTATWNCIDGPAYLSVIEALKANGMSISTLRTIDGQSVEELVVAIRGATDCDD